MADYDFLSQLQGPNLGPISLFGDAATQGIAAGKNLPTKTTAIIQGALSGIEKGQEFFHNQQQIELTQNRIEQLPIENEIRQQQLENAKLRNESATLEVALQTQTQGLELENIKAELTENISKNTDATEKREAENEFIDKFKNANPQQQAQMVLSNQYSNIFAENPALYKQSLQTVYLDPQSGLDPQTKSKIGTFFKKASIEDSYKKAAEKNLPKYFQAEDQLLEDPMTGYLLSQTDNKYSAQQIYNNSKLVPKGLYQVAPDGKTVLTKNGAPLQSPNFSGMSGETDVLFKDPQTGKLQIIGSTDAENADFKKKFNTWVGQRAIQDRSSMNAELREVDRQTAKAQTSSTANNPPKVQFGGTSQASVQKQPLYLREAQNVLKLDGAQVSRVQPILKSFEAFSMQTALDPEFRGAPSSLVQYNNIKTNLAREIAYSAFDGNPKLQQEYTPEKVERYNRDLRLQALSKFAYDRGANPDSVDSLLTPFLAENTRDLYYKTNKSIIDENIRFLENRYIQLANQRAAALRNRTLEKQTILGGFQSGGQ